MGFTSTSCNPPKALCIFCEEKWANSCMKPAQLQRHLSTKHQHHVGETPEFLKKKRFWLHSFTRNDVKSLHNISHSTRGFSCWSQKAFHHSWGPATSSCCCTDRDDAGHKHSRSVLNWAFVKWHRCCRIENDGNRHCWWSCVKTCWSIFPAAGWMDRRQWKDTAYCFGETHWSWCCVALGWKHISKREHCWKEFENQCCRSLHHLHHHL